MALILKHQTAEQFVSRVRAAYRDGQRDVLLRIARFIIGRIQSGDITDAQCRNAFGLNLLHGHFGFGFFGLPLPWGTDPDVDAFLHHHGHRSPT